MTVLRRDRVFNASSCVAVILCVFLILTSTAPVIAQIEPEVRDRVIPAAVQIFVVGEVAFAGDAEPLLLPVGSGTVVSSQGLILTNRHVVDMAEHRRMLDGWEAQAASEGQQITINLIEESVLIFLSDGERAPEPRYIATIVATDELLDLAVLQIVGDGTGLIDPATVNMPFVPLGNSDTVGLGDPIDVFSYPGISGGVLTYTEGVVSGFTTSEGGGRAWIITDATMSGGSSGGTALNRAGELIGVPTQGSAIDCRPGDVNRDGRLDANDIGCIPTGGSLGQLRPVNLARSILARAGSLDTERADGSGGSVASDHGSEHENSAIIGPPIKFLPQVLPLGHASCFRIEDEGTFTYPTVLLRFSAVPDAQATLQELGWQGGIYRTFGCDGPPDGEAGWIEINVHRFKDAPSAQIAVDFFASVHAAGTMLLPAEPPALGDYAAVLAGPAWNGSEFTIYVSEGPMLTRVTGVSPSGIPFVNVLTVARSVLAAIQGGMQSAPLSAAPPLPPGPVLPASNYLPAAPAVNYAECFQVLDRGAYSYNDVVQALGQSGVSQAQVDGLGWIDGAYAVFSCADPPSGRANQIDVVVHQFQKAEQAGPYFDHMYELGANASRACDHTQSLVVCVSGRSLSGSPLSDVHFVLSQVMRGAR